MSDDENLADATWAAGLMSAEDFAELETNAAQVEKVKDVFYLAIYKTIADSVALVNAWVDIANHKATLEQFALVNATMEGVVKAFYEMAVSYGVMNENFWKEED